MDDVHDLSAVSGVVDTSSRCRRCAVSRNKCGCVEADEALFRITECGVFFADEKEVPSLGFRVFGGRH